MTAARLLLLQMRAPLAAVLLSLLGWALGAIVSLPRTNTREVHHTCDSSDECSARLHRAWPPYVFVCCTTVVCDATRGKYYLVTSGCATKHSCKPVVQVHNDGSRLAARFEKHHWDPHEEQLFGDCPLTHERLRLPGAGGNASVVTKKAPETTTVAPTTKAAQGRCQGKCKSSDVCCVHIECIDSLQTETAEYKVEEFCTDSCPLLSYNFGAMYTFYIPAENWAERSQYEKKQSAPSVEKSCRETKFFYYWELKRQKLD
ncbi:hypothetical protein QR680_013557 [Steinernema hermaphroditum]|uniref:Uncharacterized protein n=1 Tax=Steinernema hermaphroditum TaxID=289476 RepID=A0AA39M1R5_9BILA|nr:hypothetical protein QR680_013557 [Steinernema hermaphroditum]